MRERLGCFGTRVVGVINQEVPRRDAMVPQNDAHPGHQQSVPGPFTVAKHPRQRRQRIRAEARTCKTGPANGVRHQNGRDTKSQPALLYGGPAAVWLMRTNRIVHGGHESADQGCRFAKKPGRLQAIGALSKPIGLEDNFSLTRRRRLRTMAFR